MKKVVEKYIKLDVNGRTLFWTIVIAVFGFLIQLPLFFFHTESGYPLGAYPLGWLLGSVVSVFACWSIIFMAKVLLSTSGSSGKVMGGAILSFFLRFLLYIVVLALAALSTFKPEWLNNFTGFNFWTAAGSLLPSFFLMFFFHLVEARKIKNVPVKEKEGEQHE